VFEKAAKVEAMLISWGVPVGNIAYVAHLITAKVFADVKADAAGLVAAVKQDVEGIATDIHAILKMDLSVSPTATPPAPAP